MKWDKEPTNSSGVQIGMASCYCVMKDARGMKSVVGEFIGLSHVTTQQKFYIGYVKHSFSIYGIKISYIG